MQGAEWGWKSPVIVGLFIFALLDLWCFVKIELHSKEPLLDLKLFSNHLFSAGNIILFCSTICLSSTVFWALWMQAALHFSPTMIGLALLPATIPLIFIPTAGGAWRDKFGPRGPVVTGSLLILLGVVWIIFTASTENYLTLLAGIIAFGLGIPLAIPGSCTTIMTSVTDKQSGMASGTLNTVRQLALSLGIAILSAIISSYHSAHADDLTNSYTHAFILGMIAMSIFAVIGCLFSIIYIKNTRNRKKVMNQIEIV
jgi:predicted MFS family arabinose efflux permease